MVARLSSTATAIVVLWLKIGACLFALVADVRRIVVSERLADGRALPDELAGADQFVNVATLAETLAMVAVVVAVGLWQRRTRTRIVLAWVLFGLSVVAIGVVRTFDAATPGDRQTLDALHGGAVALSIAAAVLGLVAVSRGGRHDGPTARSGAAGSSGLTVVREDDLPD